MDSNGSAFQERFNGRMSMMSKDGEQGVAARAGRPIEKLHETGSSMFTHLNMSSAGNDMSDVSSSHVTPRYSLNKFQQSN